MARIPYAAGLAEELSGREGLTVRALPGFLHGTHRIERYEVAWGEHVAGVLTAEVYTLRGAERVRSLRFREAGAQGIVLEAREWDGNGIHLYHADEGREQQVLVRTDRYPLRFADRERQPGSGKRAA